MTIKSDRWIRQMALEHGMIEPFVDEQMRRGVISYGLTSYGYDVRVANEFKVFSNVFNVIVDPKNFNARSFVDIEGDYCDIPPNSFALARSVERFRIPRNVLCLVIGKSSYARCFSGDTRVALVDGTNPTLEEMAHRSEQGELFWGYSIGQHGRVIVTLLEAPRYIGRDKLVEVVLDTGTTIRATPDHQFLLRDGRVRAAEELRPSDSLMPLYKELARGYEMVYQPLNGFFYPTHRLSDEWNLRNGVYSDLPNTHRHHRDHDRQNNAPMQRYYAEPAHRALRSAISKRAWAQAGVERHMQQAEVARGLKLRAEITAEVVRAALDQTGSLRGAARLLNCDRAVFRRFPEVIHAFKGTTLKNHKVTAVRTLSGEHDVFCLTVPEAGNFALDAGVFVSNCGLIVNITPLEPEWEGYVTIEISNTTPLPARIYANEGIGQILFLESDEPPEVSYRDKQGKYQDQVGIVLPKVEGN